MRIVKFYISYFIILLGLLAITGTGGSDEKDDPVKDSTSDTVQDVTYGSDIQSIMSTSCISCHAEDKVGSARNGAPTSVNLDTYDNLVASADRADARIQAGTMPPSGSLSDENKLLFSTWIDDGMMEN